MLFLDVATICALIFEVFGIAKRTQIPVTLFKLLSASYSESEIVRLF